MGHDTPSRREVTRAPAAEHRPAPEPLPAAAIRVQVGSIAGRDESSVRASIDGAVERLEGSGWYRMITVRDEEESVYVLALERDGLLQGLSVFVHDGEKEVVLVNIAGDMDPELIGSLIRNVDQLEGLRDDK